MAESKGLFTGYIRYDGSDNHLLDPVPYSQNNVLKGFPSREDIVQAIDNKLAEQTNAEIDAGAPLHFMPTDIVDEHDKAGNYILNMFGCVASGDKAHIIITGIKPSFDILVRGDSIDTHKRIETLLEGRDTKIHHIEDIKAKLFMGYCEELKPFKRIFFNSTWDRSKAIEKVAKTVLGGDIYSDDKSYYYRKVARENNLPLSAWLELRSYKVLKNRDKILPGNVELGNVLTNRINACNSTFVLTCELSGIRAYTGPRLIEEYMKKDRTLEIAWDAETYTPHRTGQIPIAKEPDDRFIEICGTVHWKNDPNPLMRLCVISEESMVEPNPNRFTILCNNHEGIIKGFAHVVRALKPDIMGDFNGSDYDWRFYLGKARAMGLLSYVVKLMSCIPLKRRTTLEKIEKWYIRDMRVKINPETSWDARILKVPGILPIDACLVYGRMLEFARNDSSRKQSLNSYCQKVGLPGKIDVSILDMWKTFEAKDSPERRKAMELYVEYCIIDSLRTHQLMIARNVVDEHRDVATMAYVSLFDAFYYAGGMKVCNLLAAYAGRPEFNILMQMQVRTQREKGKYPGAWVGNPKKGLHNRRPVTGLDAQSLYPSMIRAYNLSPDTYLGDKHTDGSRDKITNVSSVFNSKPVLGSFMRHENDKKKMGLFPSVLGDLFDKRAQIKKELKPLKEHKERIEKDMSNEEKLYKEICDNINDMTLEEAKIKSELHQNKKSELTNTTYVQPDNSYDSGTKLLRLGVIKEKLELLDSRKIKTEFHLDNYNKMIRDVCFDIDKLDSKQKATKIYMNTFYGEAGNQLSPIYLLQLACGVTQYGRYTIGFVRDFVLKEGFEIVYGDTDSVYLIAPDRYYVDLDEKYKTKEISKLVYWESMILRTMKSIIPELCARVNKALMEDTFTILVNMAYEEVLMPLVLAGRKKYYGIPHEGEVNLRPKKLFTRGIDTIKQGQTDYMKKIGNKIMWDSMNVDNEKTLEEIVLETLRWATSSDIKWTTEQFVKVKTYKTAKKNLTVHQFVDRMKIKHDLEKAEMKLGATTEFLYTPPESGEKFKCVMVKPQYSHDMYGKIVSRKVGNLMEYLHVVKKLGLPIDIEYYLKQEVVGMCARFIMYQKKFMCNEELKAEADGKLDSVSDATLKQFDAEAQKRAKKYLVDFVGKLTSGPVQKKTYGLIAKKTYKNVKDELEHKNIALDYELYGDEKRPIHENLQNIIRHSAAMANEILNGTFYAIKEELKKNDTYAMLTVYNMANVNSVARVNMRLLDIKEKQLTDTISKNLISCLPECKKYKQTLFDIINKTREQRISEAINKNADSGTVEISSEMNDKLKSIVDTPIVSELKSNIDELINIMFVKLNYTNIYAYLLQRRDEIEKFTAGPTEQEKQEILKQDLIAHSKS